MSLKISMPQPDMDLKPRITVVGVGGAGGNAVNNMIRSNLSGVEFLVANTDAQALEMSSADQRIQLGLNLTHGLGAGARPEIGRAAAEEAIEEIMGRLSKSHMVFITAGMGGGTGTGAAPVIARAARESGVLTVGVVTKPFHFEGANRMRAADSGIEELAKHVDTLIIIPNQNLFRIANEKTTFAEAFQLADDVLYSGVRGVTDLMVMPGLINLDFADIRTVMAEMGKAMMGTGEAEGEDRARQAAEAAISNPLLDEISMQGARGVLINITGGADMTLLEVDAAANRIREEVDDDANIIFGATMDQNLDGAMRVSIVATGIDTVPGQKPLPIEPFTSSVIGKPIETVPPRQAPAVAATLAQVVQTNSSSEALEAVDEETSIQVHQKEDLAESNAIVAETETQEDPDKQPEDQASSNKGTAWTFPSKLESNSSSARDDAFIPEAAETTKPIASPHPEAAPAALSSPPRPRRTFISLFDRMTGATRHQDAETVAPPVEPKIVPKIETPSAENPVVDQDQAEDKKSAKTDEYLDIPTFLRRQAN
ncbi:MAG: cell division protein FtsZ [Alphaproteobacteria bacterium]